MHGVLLCLLLFGLGCSSSGAPSADAAADQGEAATDAGIESPSDGATGDATCTLVKPYSTKQPDCNACAGARCCAEVNGCLGDKRCDDDYVNCALACALGPDGGDAGACLADCAGMYPEGKARYDAAIKCVDTRCSDRCK